jgi:hypothetical protein
MYIKGSTDLDPSQGVIQVSPAFISNNPAVFVRLDFSNLLTNLNSEKKISFLNVIPNPANDKITIDKISEPFTITMFNHSGQEVYHKKCQANTQIIDISGLIMGNYVLTIKAQSRSFTTKFLKQ